MAVWANAANDDASRRAYELLELGEKQNDDNHALAAETTKQALVLFQSINDVAGQAATHDLLGDCYLAQNMMSQATQHYELALYFWRHKENLERQANALISLSYVEIRKGDWLSGISYLTQANSLIGDQPYFFQLGRIATGLAYLFNESGLPEEGLKHYQKAMEYYRRADKTESYNRMIMLVGYTNFLIKNYPAALTYLQQALNNFESLTDKKSKLNAAECHEYLGQVYLATGQDHLALQHLQPVPPQYMKAANDRDAAHVIGLIGQIYERLGALDRAQANYLEASRIFRQFDDRVRDAAVRFALGRLELNRNNFDAAESYLQESIKTTEDLRNDLKSRLFATAFSASVHERYEAYISCLMRKHRQQPAQGHAARAFEASELARARSLAELLRDTQTRIVSGADPELIKQERTIRQAIRAKVEQSITLLAGDHKKEELEEVQSSLSRLRYQHRQLVEALQKQNEHYDQIKEPVSYSLQQIQEQIVADDQTMLLEYFLGKNTSYVWVVTRNDIKVFDLPAAEVITNAVRVVYELLAAEPNRDTDDQLKRATDDLAQKVLGPLQNQLTARRLIVVADGALNYIPFQLLPGMANSQTPLVETYEIVNAPSASILGQLRHEKQQRQPKTKILAAFGDPVFQTNYAHFKNSASGAVTAANASELGLEQRNSRSIEVQADSLDPAKIQPLIYSKFELNNLSEIAGPGSLIARDFDASRAVLERTDLSKYAILHFATHALLNTKNPENSGFYLSMLDRNGQRQPGFITMEDIYGLQAPVDLVVLSACRTGLGKDVRGEGLIGLTRGFMHAGASSVVASLWKVDDEATSELMKYFYTNMLRKGMRPAEALREAQNTLRQNPAWQTPHFWAGFTLQGEFKEPIRLPEPTGAPLAVQKAVGLALLLILLLGIAWGFWRRRKVSS